MNSKTGLLKSKSQRNIKKKKKEKSEESLHGLCDTIKRNNLCIIVIPEEEREKEQKVEGKREGGVGL